MTKKTYSYLALKGCLILQHVNQIRVINLEQHASNFTRQIWVHAVDQRVQPLSQHLLLFLQRGSGQHGSGQWLLALDHHSLLWRRGSGVGDHLSHNLLRWVSCGWRVLEALCLSRASHLVDGCLDTRTHHHLLRHRLDRAGLCGQRARSWTRSALHSGCHSQLGSSGTRHALLGSPSGLGTHLGGCEVSLGLRHGGHVVALLELHVAHGWHTHTSHALDVLRCQVSLTILLALSKGHIQRLGDNVSAVHLCDGLGSLLGRREADEAEALASALLAAHDLGAGDGAERCKFLTQHLVVNGIVKILNVQVNSLVPRENIRN